MSCRSLFCEQTRSLVIRVSRDRWFLLTPDMDCASVASRWLLVWSKTGNFGLRVIGDWCRMRFFHQAFADPSGIQRASKNESSALIRVDKYQKAYDKTLAVHDLSFEVPAGAIMGMVGPNGAGKTTTLRAIAGIIQPTAGQISVSGYNVVTQPIEAKKRVALIPDDPKLFESLTVWEHLKFVAAAYQIADYEPVAEELLVHFELMDKRNSLSRELSRGMRQKLAIACAYLQQPTAIIFDEPHTGLDPLGIRRMKSTIRQRAASGAAVIVSSHLLDLIEDLCTHLLIISKGRALFCGTLSELRGQHPELKTGTPLEEIFFKATVGHLPIESDIVDPLNTEDNAKSRGAAE